VPAVLVVEDDALIASSLGRALEANGYDVRAAGTVAAAVAALDDAVPDAVLLDLGLPDGDGTAIAELVVRRHPRVPVIVLTARDSELDIVAGLGSGAVDYVVKPFRLGELLARIASHVRFAAANEPAPATAGGPAIVVGDLTIDRAARRVSLGAAEVSLRPKEFDLLERLGREAGCVVTRERLIDEVWDEHWWGSTKTLDVHINSLRRKLGEQPGGPSRITTIRGIGYRLDAVRPA
jgi:DNA-binding response OmpR family regulator